MNGFVQLHAFFIGNWNWPQTLVSTIPFQLNLPAQCSSVPQLHFPSKVLLFEWDQKRVKLKEPENSFKNPTAKVLSHPYMNLNRKQSSHDGGWVRGMWLSAG